MRTTERTAPRSARGAARAAVAPRPVTSGDPVEARLARSAVLAVAVLSLPVAGVAAALAGAGGALAAAVAAVVVAGMFLMSGGMLSWAARIGPTAMLAAALGGYALRLMIYTLLIVLLRPVDAIHGPSLAISAAVLLVAALAWEVRAASRTPGLYWVDATASRPRTDDDRRGRSPLV